ncbi:MAG: rubredoxin [Sphingobium sp.]|nr:rubredoxin [Sphingobium sp.]
MSDHFFAGSYGGDDARLADNARLECKICWHVYDPAEGDGYWQIPAGTPFAALPDHWTCPNCDAAKSGFLVIE